MRPSFLLAAATSLIAAAPSDADACSQAICSGMSFTPTTSATVPANLPAIYWHPIVGPSASPPDPGKVVLATAAAPGTPLPLTATTLPGGGYALAPDQPLIPGTQYVLTDQSTCANIPIDVSVRFQAAAAAPLPTVLGALAETTNLIGPVELSSGSGTCSTEVEAHQIGIVLQFGSDAIAWRDMLHFETLVDGEVWRASQSAPSSPAPGSSWRGRGLDLLYRVCKTTDPGVSEGLSAGPHEVTMRATLPGSSIALQSSPLAVGIACTDDLPNTGGTSGGCDAGTGSSGWLLLGSLAAMAGLRRRTARRPRADDELPLA